MESLLICVLILGFGTLVIPSPVAQLKLGKELKDLVRKRTLEKLGRADLIPDLPSTLRLNHTSLIMDSDTVKGTFALSNLVATGLNTLVDDITLNLVTQKVTVSIIAPETVKVKGDYKLDGSVVASEDETLSLDGSGPFSGSVTNMNVGGEGKLEVGFLSGGTVKVKDLELTVSYDAASTNAENFRINEESVDWESFNTDLNENFDSLWNSANEPVATALTEALNEALSGYTWPQILDFVNGKQEEDDAKKKLVVVKVT